MTTSSDHAKSVELRLSILQYAGTIEPFPERRITFTKERDVVSVGRSSKVSTKGFIAGIDNVWIDNPVMSRLHARLTARMDKNEIEIKDLGSLHGTFLNDERIPADQWREVKDGDTLRFGAPISRGNEEFLPTTAKVGIECRDCNNSIGAGTSGTGTFQVPDDSDDDGASDDGQSRMLDGHTPIAQKAAVRTTAEIIDLTNGYGDSQVHREVIDLSSEYGSPIRMDEDQKEDQGVSKPVDNGDGRIGPAADSESVNCEREEPVRRESCAGNGNLPHLDQILGANRVPEAEHRYWLDSEDEDNFEDDENTNSPSGYTDEDSEVDYPEESSDSDMHDDDELEGECDDGMDETESDEESSSEKGRSTYDNNHIRWEGIPPEMYQYPEIMPLVHSLSRGAGELTPPRPGRQSPARAPLPPQSWNTTGLSIERLLNATGPHSPIPTARQEPDQAETASSGPFGNLDAVVSRAEALGAITGKTDFFMAREHNKIALVGQMSAAARPTSSVHALCNPDAFVGEPSTYRFGPAGQQTEASSRPSETYEEPAELVSSPAIPSSVTISNEEADGYSGRTNMGISNIVEPNQPCSPGDRQLKRKAEEISETTEEQEEWAVKATKAPSPAPSLPSSEQQEQQPESSKQHAEPEPAAEPEPESEVQSESVEVLPEPSEPARQAAVSIASSCVPERPIKRARMMRVAERLGYAALGGVTAGAMVLGTLIYTAPTFG
ncbi:hypothetical protein N658DRAFT_185101 [Parathielavia hyrcaniae]|uniref:FHA domain-containing protein n=1 Tax=Parathielavia hyrcaniae TaxID=113614 RepID=A0AAN6Q6S7_9PEZI|nr:hypothetical protein N658DRAFT_185101 [Parathielavia hyrcaniae]